MADPADSVSVERVISAPPEKIFELLADPKSHRKFDGSDSVRDPKNAPDRLSLGATFDMAMKLGLPYTMTNEVVEFEEGRRIAWQPRPKARIARNLGGRIWRYELEPVDGGTRVRETWDISQEKGMKGLVRKGADHTRKNMEKTLERIDYLVTRN
jgi:uncharacterized protein YndB with AHSA1/START domain